MPSLTIKGLLDGRLAFTDTPRSWEDKGFGKTRYGGDATGDHRELARLAEAAAVMQAHLTWDLSAVVHITANSQQRHAVDVVEAYVQYKPAPTGNLGVRLKAGAFFPPISLENTNLAWTSPYTISSSAINTWVGEELRTIGAEASAVYRSDTWDASLSAALYGFNDPTGSLLTWRGWAIHDREAGLFERLPLAPLPNFKVGSGSAPGQAGAVDPFKELDDRIGVYIAGGLNHDDGYKLRAIYYDNRANNRVFDGRQYAWHTRFGAVSAATDLTEGLEVVAQGMAGRTTMASFPTHTVADNDFASAFVLLSHTWDQHRLSGRAEIFDINDNDHTPDDPNAEHGTALTVSYVYRPTPTQRLTIEALHVNSNRDVRARFGQSRRQSEDLVQLSYRLFFSWE
ncbi:MAG: hypothetical protein JNM81_12595 [Rhodospirillaceae bacterium]|nr:hypothetical protein [Rhodospirillaceae bacterium]